MEKNTNHLQEAYDHLWNGRFRLALQSAKKAYDENPIKSDSLICYAWALLENGNPAKAIEYANLAVEVDPMNSNARMIRGFLLVRMGIFEGAISDLDYAMEENKKLIAQGYIAKAKAYASVSKFNEALIANELGITLSGKNNNSKYFLELAQKITESKNKISSKTAEKLIVQIKESLKQNESWFALFVSRRLLDDKDLKKEFKEIELLEIEAMIKMFQFKPAEKKLNQIENDFIDDSKFKELKDYVDKCLKTDENEDEQIEFKSRKTITKDLLEDKIGVTKKTNLVIYPNNWMEIFSAKLFDVFEDKNFGVRRYYNQVSIKKIREVGLEVIYINPYYELENKILDCEIIWYLNDFQIFKNKFQIKSPSDWDTVIFAQTCGDFEKKVWTVKGQAKIDLYVDNFRVLEKYFYIDEDDVFDEEDEVKKSKENKTSTKIENETKDKSKKEESTLTIKEPDETKTLEEILKELNTFIGLDPLKKSIYRFIDYLKFIEERKKQGLKASDNISLHAVFLGNPGTGKTTIARLFGDIYRAMGILEKGHVVEVDRSSLVGQYIGETAQKTEKAVKEAIGGVLFIDEAYTLIKKGASNDFGQEAIDVILKRMEDLKGQFIVVAAGYPEEMKSFIGSNPGLQSRFTNEFIFDDYTPSELIKIFDLQLSNEEYKIADDAKIILEKKITELYRKRDSSFGNARLIKRIFEQAKINLGKRFSELKEEERSKDNLVLINNDDIKSIFEIDKKSEIDLPINEELLEEGLYELNSLTGLTEVKKEINEMVKLVKHYKNSDEDISSKYVSHILFTGNPGTGKTTVARIFSKIFSALGVLKKGHLIETDRQGLVANYVGQTATQTNAVIDKAFGGTLFIDEAYTLIKQGSTSDFGIEAVETLLKRMEDDKGKFICIAAGYSEEMKIFVESNPGLKSRFTKTIYFEDYNPKELLTISENLAASKKLSFKEETRDNLLKHFNEIYRTRDKHFGNARIVRNLFEEAERNRLLRIAENSDSAKELLFEDFKSISTKRIKEKYKVSIDYEKMNNLIDELNNLTGLQNVKDGVNKLVSSLKVSILRKERGLKIIDKSLHSVFMGNPGTGKTTVARLYSKILKEMGLLEKGHLVEVDRSALVAGYQGQTAAKTDKIIESAIGGTLFIDEAYTLSRGANDFGQEAIDTLLKRMEDYQNQLVVITAGYPNEMKKFINSNPGLLSRFTNIFNFEDYNPRQLLEIAYQISKQSGYKLDEGALQMLLEIFNEIYAKRDPNFGNARTAKNILYKAISNQEARIAQLLNPSNEELVLLTYQDFENINI